MINTCHLDMSKPGLEMEIGLIILQTFGTVGLEHGQDY